MSKYQALIDALDAGPTEGPWKKRNGFDGEIEIFRPDASLKRPYIAHQICTVERDHMDAKANIAFLLAANPATIRALLADLEMAEKALKAVAEWGPFPRVPDSYSDEPGATVSYAVAFGSNGERDYIRGIAQASLAQMAGW